MRRVARSFTAVSPWDHAAADLAAWLTEPEVGAASAAVPEETHDPRAVPVPLPHRWPRRGV